MIVVDEKEETFPTLKVQNKEKEENEKEILEYGVDTHKQTQLWRKLHQRKLYEYE